MLDSAYVALEGIDTTGKSTQMELLKGRYKNAIFTKEPSDSEFGGKIRDLVLHSPLGNVTQALLFMADRAEHHRNLIFPNTDKLIITDRSLISGIAYGVEFERDILVRLNLSIAKKPNLAIILKTNKEILESRLSQKERDFIEQKGIDYLLKIQDNIIATTHELGIKSVIIECDKPQDEILAIICAAIDSMIDSVVDSTSHCGR